MLLEDIKQIMLDNKDSIFYKDITYGKLYECISIFSKYLQKLENCNKKVLIYGHKDISFIISMLSCAYAGFTYIPVDKSFSKDRVQDIMDIAKPSVILDTTKDNIIKNIITDVNKEVIQISYDEINNILNNEKKDEIFKNKLNLELFPKLKAGELFYIIFTSGSTGKPKGVEITYQNLDTFCNRILKKISVKKGAVILNQALFSFDLSIADIYLTLLNASKYLMLSKEEIQNYPTLFSKIKNEKVEVIVSTPSFIDYLLIDKSFNKENIKKLSTIFTCGELLSAKTVEKVKERFNDISFINAYGPTECTVAVTTVEVDEKMEKIPAGKVEDDSFCIVDDNLNPIEEKGNILVYGDFVTNGYINYPNTSFVDFEGKKAYITGDIGYIENGKLYYVSRKDRQIKINGYRVELGELENKIRSVDTVEKCVVVEKKNNAGYVTKIVAYVIATESEKILKDKLKDIISSYMFPDIRVVKNLPLNDNYKIDVKKIRDEEYEK